MACSEKFTPIRGLLYFDADNCLPEALLEDVAPSGMLHYHSMVTVFRKGVQQKLLDLNYFLVGAGAIRCKMINNWAHMGVVCRERARCL